MLLHLVLLDLDVVTVVFGGLDESGDAGQVVEGGAWGGDDQGLVLSGDGVVEVVELVVDTEGLLLGDIVDLLLAGVLGVGADADADDWGGLVVQLDHDGAVVTVDLEVDPLVGGTEGGSVAEGADALGVADLDGGEDDVVGTGGLADLAGEGGDGLDLTDKGSQQSKLVDTTVGEETADVLWVLSPGGGHVLVVGDEWAGGVVLETDDLTDTWQVLLGDSDGVKEGPVLGDGDWDVSGLGSVDEGSGLLHVGGDWLLDLNGLAGSDTLLDDLEVELSWQQSIDVVDLWVLDQSVHAVIDLVGRNASGLGEGLSLSLGLVESSDDLELIWVVLEDRQMTVSGKDTGTDNTNV